jgi:cysteine synthase A
MARVGNNISELIGETPLVKLNFVVDSSMANVYLKLESFNPCSSVKDRIGVAMIEAAEKEGKLIPGKSVILEPTSGNTGIALAMAATSKGYRCILVMPETMTVERRKLMKALGAEIILTPGIKGIKGAVEHAQELLEENPSWFMPQQFENPANPQIHRETTGKELLAQGDIIGGIDAFLGGIGTGGTLTGVGEVLKEKYPSIQIVGIEPAASPILNGGRPGPHKIQGIGTGFIPGVLNQNVYQEVLRVENDDAFYWAREVARKEGILVGISSGAAIKAALEIAKRLGPGKNVVAIAPDTGERYLSTDLFNYEDEDDDLYF